MPWIYLIILFIIKQQFNDVDKRAQIWYAMDLFDHVIHHQTTIQWCRQASPDMIYHGFIWLFYSSSNNNSMTQTSEPRYDIPSYLFDDILLYTVCRYTFSYEFMFGENQSKKCQLLKMRRKLRNVYYHMMKKGHISNLASNWLAAKPPANQKPR